MTWNLVLFILLAGAIWLGGRLTLHFTWLYGIDHFSALVRSGVVPSESIALPDGRTGDWADAYHYVIRPPLLAAGRLVDLAALVCLACAISGAVVLYRTRRARPRVSATTGDPPRAS